MDLLNKKERGRTLFAKNQEEFGKKKGRKGDLKKEDFIAREGLSPYYDNKKEDPRRCERDARY